MLTEVHLRIGRLERRPCSPLVELLTPGSGTRAECVANCSRGCKSPGAHNRAKTSKCLTSLSSSSYSSFGVKERFIEIRADVNAKTESLETALFRAVKRKGRSPLVRFCQV